MAASSSSSTVEDESDVELGHLLALLLEEMRRRVSKHLELHRLIEVVMDLGRKPLARFPSGDFVLSDHPITFQDLEHATSQQIRNADLIWPGEAWFKEGSQRRKEGDKEEDLCNKTCIRPCNPWRGGIDGLLPEVSWDFGNSSIYTGGQCKIGAAKMDCSWR
ncbi:PREDICTED: uncharacterized protein LOC104596559 [Nelumbo nucifera]|uniref:Uncharacterized protein LOC104596559 n=2 Tax=Nelumbo nucifera TaxID=4432 RepID=A0A1U8A496_NELNU|nr:PREDICTED: uncharacterized protein LOC104596559 [Nelumbo nucifera]DAD19578.1 TPA_asm: hypothetical protein HUJ06_021041 [Nelumbo nucifera]